MIIFQNHFEHWHIFNKDYRLQVNNILFLSPNNLYLCGWVWGLSATWRHLDCLFAFQICTPSRGCVYSWWSSGRIWTSRETFLELPNAWRRLRSRHRHDGKTNGQWPPCGMCGNNQRNCRGLQQLGDGVFQYGIFWSVTLLLRGKNNACSILLVYRVKVKTQYCQLISPGP